MKRDPKFGVSTLAVHAGELRDNEHSAITTIVQSSTFISRNTDDARRLSMKHIPYRAGTDYAFAARGNRMKNVVPLPSSVSNLSSPPCLSTTTDRAMASP
jgi:hypothetical protein